MPTCTQFSSNRIIFGGVIYQSSPATKAPLELSPEPQIVPSFFKNRECRSLAEILVISESASIWIGSSLLTYSPSPSCPYWLPPQPHTVPSLFKNRECIFAASIATISLSPTI